MGAIFLQIVEMKKTPVYKYLGWDRIQEYKEVFCFVYLIANLFGI